MNESLLSVFLIGDQHNGRKKITVPGSCQNPPWSKRPPPPNFGPCKCSLLLALATLYPVKLVAIITMEAKLKKELGTAMLKSTGHSGGGCISEGQSYDTDNGRVFVKINHKKEVCDYHCFVFELNILTCIQLVSGQIRSQ